MHDNEKQPFIAAYDRASGREVWRKDRDVGTKGAMVVKSAWVTPYVWRHDGRTEIVTVGPALAISYDTAGNEVWRMSGMGGAPIPMSFASDGLLFLNGGRGRPLYAIRPGATGDISLKTGERTNGFVAWSEPRGGTYLPSALAYQGGLYVVTETGILTRFDAKTGAVTYKTRIDPAATAFTSSPWAHNGKVFFLSEEGTTFVVAAGDTFKLLRTNELEGMALATPAMVGERQLLRAGHGGRAPVAAHATPAVFNPAQVLSVDLNGRDRRVWNRKPKPRSRLSGWIVSRAIGGCACSTKRRRRSSRWLESRRGPLGPCASRRPAHSKGCPGGSRGTGGDGAGLVARPGRVGAQLFAPGLRVLPGGEAR